MLNNKTPSRGVDIVADVLSPHISDDAYQLVLLLETNEKMALAAADFNKLPFLKRLLDLCVIHFWLVSVACVEYYESESRDKICEQIENILRKVIGDYEVKQQLSGVVLKDYIKDEEERIIFLREYPVGLETRIGFNAILDIIILKRFVDYNHAHFGQDVSSHTLFNLAGFMCRHIFGKEYAEKYEGIVFGTALIYLLMAKLQDYRIMINSLEGNVPR